MTAQEFHQRMLALLRRAPFEPFEVELRDGQRPFIHRAESVATNGGTAVFGDAHGDLHIFDYLDTLRRGRDTTAQAS